MEAMTRPTQNELTRQRMERAGRLAQSGSLSLARQQELLPRQAGLTLSKALVLGLLQQQVKTFFSVLGHGSTEEGEVLRIYQQAGLVKVFGVRSEIKKTLGVAADSAYQYKFNTCWE